MVTHPARSFGPSHDVSFEFPKIAPSPYSSRGVHSRFHVAVVASENGNQPLSRSASVVSHHLGGLLFLDPPRIFVGVPVLGFMTFHAALRHNPRHEVLPFEALLLVCSGLNRCRSTLQSGSRHLPGFPVSSPCALPPRPWSSFRPLCVRLSTIPRVGLTRPERAVGFAYAKLSFSLCRVRFRTSPHPEQNTARPKMAPFLSRPQPTCASSDLPRSTPPGLTLFSSYERRPDDVRD